MASNKGNASKAGSARDVGSNFWASTPLVSPRLRQELEESFEDNMNNTVRVRTPGHGQQTVPEANGNVVDVPQAGPSKLGEREMFLSPFAEGRPNNFIDTMYDETIVGAGTTAKRSRRRRGQKKPTDFPFPKPSCMTNGNVGVDKYESFLGVLQLLKQVQALEEDSGLTEVVAPTLVGVKISSAKKQSGPKKEFAFTKDMFKSNNSEAFIEVTHFLFVLFDKVEATHRFRNAWPIYEKKQESLYRRAALEWFKELIVEHPKFFARCVKVDQLQGLVVNPYGDRFIKFIHSFADLVMYKVSSQMDEIGDPLLEKPVYTGNPEITKRQVTVLSNRTTVLEEAIVQLQTARVEEVRTANLLNKEFSQLVDDDKCELEQRFNSVQRVIKKYPHFFPPNVANMLDEEDGFVKAALKERPIIDRSTVPLIETPLLTAVQAKRVMAVQELGTKVMSLLEFFKKHSRLWTLLQYMGQKVNNLNSAHLYLPMERHENLSLVEVLDSYEDIAKASLEGLNAIDVAPLANRKSDLHRRISILQQRLKDVETMDTVNLHEFKRQLEFESKKLEILLENVDWGKYSGLDEAPLSSMFNFSPPRTVDTSKETGLTPAITSYLPSLDLSKLSKDSNRDSNRRKTEVHVTSDISRQNLSKMRTGTNPIQSRNTSADSCDSPVSHLPSKTTIEAPVLVQPRNSLRRNSVGKFRLSLPPAPEDDEEAGLENNASSINAEFRNAGSTPLEIDYSKLSLATPGTSSDSGGTQARMNQLLKCFADAAAETPLVASKALRKSKRRSSLGANKGDKAGHDSSGINHSSYEDLEEKLGIMDVTLSYADYLDLSLEEDDDDAGDED